MNSSCANWLIPFLPTVVYYPVVLLFICEKTKAIVQFFIYPKSLFTQHPAWDSCLLEAHATLGYSQSFCMGGRGGGV